MRLHRDSAETEPMLSSTDRNGPGTTLEIDDTQPPLTPRFSRGYPARLTTPSGASVNVKQWAETRFKMLYCVLCTVCCLALIAIVIGAIMLIQVKGMDLDIKHAMKNASEQYRFLYETVETFRNGRHGTFKDLSSVTSSLTPEQLAMAKQFGLIPNTPNVLAPGVDPIQPIIGQATDRTIVSEPGADTAVPKPDESIPLWSTQPCEAQCARAGYDSAPLVIISLDGFAHEYLKRKLVPSLERLARCGARAERVYPSYPSKTFPNHYTIATGLYPEAHGIVDNSVYDPTISPKLEDMKKTKYAKFYGGEPIWSLAVREGKRMYCLFWPGCSYNITGHNPTWDLPYNKSLQYSARVDMVIDWLSLPANTRPDLIMAYFDQPDYVGHFHTTDEQVNVELVYLETVINYLFTRLYHEDLLNCVNIVILSDHGMKFLNRRIYVDETINIKGMVVANGVNGRIHLANSSLTEEDVEKAFACPADRAYRVYSRPEMPKRLHFAKTSRIGDIVLEGEDSIFFPTKSGDYGITSDHGFDFLDPDMWAIFFARGPSIAPGVVVPPFQNIEYFNLFVDILGLPHVVPNNGTLGVLTPVLRGPVLRPFPPSDLRILGSCPQTVVFQPMAVRSCAQNDAKPLCKAKVDAINAGFAACPLHQPPFNFFHTQHPEACLIDLCSISIVSTPTASVADGTPLAVTETITADEARNALAASAEEKALAANCSVVDARFLESICNDENNRVPRHRQKATLLANGLNELRDLHRAQHIFHPKALDAGPFAYLQNLTLQYAKRYQRLIVVTGPVYDNNLDGLADNSTKNGTLPATHFFRILMRCEDNNWNIDGLRCERPVDTRVLSFVVPNAPADTNCQTPLEMLLTATARVRDIELLTGLQFFREPLWYTEAVSLSLRTNVTIALWDS